MKLIILIIIVIIFIIIYLLLTEIERWIESTYDINFHKIIYPVLYLKTDNIQYSDKSIVICTLARNAKKYIYNTIKNFENIGMYFKKYKIIIFENDSDDNTRQIIKQWVYENSNVHLLDCLDFGVEDCKFNLPTGYESGVLTKSRIDKMCFYREQYLKYIKKYFYNYDYMLVADFDLNGSFNMNEFMSMLEKNLQWDAIFINGRTPIPGTLGLFTIPYDNIAFVDINDKYNNHKISIYDLIKKIILMEYYVKNTDQLISVKSAFNGYGIYKISSILNASYIGDTNCEHTNLAKNINGKLYINPKWIGYFDKQGPEGGLIYLLLECFK